MKIRLTAALTLLSSLALMAAAALAHDPFIEEEDAWGSFETPWQAPDPAISYALYGYLDGAESVDVFQYDFEEADALLQIELLVPVCGEHYVDFMPRFAVLGPAADDLPIGSELPFIVPLSLAVYYPGPADMSTAEATPEPDASTERPTFTEPFGGTVFYDGPRLDYRVPVAGRYNVVVYDPAGQSGDYTLATGYVERFNSPRSRILANVQAIRSGGWLHRRCDLSPADPAAIIEPDHSQP